MSTEQSFFDDIRENPQDDGPRLIFADWLEENGNPERADLIRVQVELAALGIDDTAKRFELRCRERELWQKHQKEWMRDIRPFAPKASCSRGFADQLSIKAKLFVEHGDSIFTHTPAWSIKIRDAKGQASALSKCAGLAKASSVSFNSGNLGAAGCRTLLESPHLENVVTLDLDNNSISRGGFEAFLQYPWQKLTHLHLENNNVGNSVFPQFTESPLLSQLKTLRLAQNSLRDDALEALAEADGLAGLEDLDLRGNYVADGLPMLFASKGLKDLKRLGLNRIQESGGGFQYDSELIFGALAEAKSLRGLTYLDLTSWPMATENAWGTFASTKYLRNLETLDLGNSFHLDAAHARQLTKLTIKKLKSLNLAGNGLTSEILSAIVEAPFLKSVQDLNLKSNQLFDDGAKAVADSAMLASLRKLRLSGIFVEDDGAIALADSPHLTRLRHLDFEVNKIGDAGAKAIAESKTLQNLETLNLSRNQIGDKGAEALAASPYLQYVTELRLEVNQGIRPSGRSALRKRFGWRVILD